MPDDHQTSTIVGLEMAIEVSQIRVMAKKRPPMTDKITKPKASMFFMFFYVFALECNVSALFVSVEKKIFFVQKIISFTAFVGFCVRLLANILANIGQIFLIRTLLCATHL